MTNPTDSNLPEPRPPLRPEREGALPPQDEEVLRGFQDQADAEATSSAYGTDLRQFFLWCAERNLTPFPAMPKTVAGWAAALAASGDYKASSIQRKLAAISSAHTRKDHDSPVKSSEVKRAMRGIKKRLGVKPEQVHPLLPEDMKAIARVAPKTLRWLRTRTMLWVGLACGLRRSELVRIELAHVTLSEQGAEILIKKSKTDQEGRGRIKFIPSDVKPWRVAVILLRKWIARAGITDGFLFRRLYGSSNVVRPEPPSRKSVERMLRKAVRLIGKNPDNYGGHSMRAGLVTKLRSMGKDDATIMRQTGHSNPRTMRSYDRPQDPFGSSNPLR